MTSQGKILVVDDLPQNLRLLSDILKQKEYETRLTRSGKLALLSAPNFQPDLILLDIKMPEMNGYQVCAALKADPKTRDIPVIFLTALDEAENKVQAFEMGGVDYVTKPFQAEEILARVRNQLSLVSLRRELEEKIADLQRYQQETSLLLEVTQALNAAPSLNQAFDNVLRLICEKIAWDLAEAWLPSWQRSYLKCAYGRYAKDSGLSEFRQRSWDWTFAIGEGLPGRIWLNRQAEWLEDVSVVPPEVYRRCRLAARVGLKAALGVPVLTESGDLLAVLVFYSRRATSCQLRVFQLVSAVASQLGSLLQRKQAEEKLRQEKEKTERLLLNILPAPIATRLSQGEETIADSVEDVSILFADIVGFTPLSSRKTAQGIVELLNDIFSSFDILTQKYSLEKIKTLGDAYMVAGGVPVPHPTHHQAIASLALDMQETVTEFVMENQEPLQLRIGIHAGPVVAGVIGINKFSYDLWGDTVNVASRLETLSLPGKIQASESVYLRLRDRFLFRDRGVIELKGRGRMRTYWLEGCR